MAGVVTGRTAALLYLVRGEGYGEEIRRGIGSLAGMAGSDSSIRPALEQLALAGLVSRRWAPAPPAEKPRKTGPRGGGGGHSLRCYYKLTPAGRRQAEIVRRQLQTIAALGKERA